MIKAIWGNYETAAETAIRREGTQAPRRVLMQLGRTQVDVIHGAGIRKVLVTRSQA